MRIMIKGGVWKNTEDEILKAAVMKYGKNQWARISSLLVRKSAKQCKARWYEWLDPSIKKTEWTREEDEKLLHLAKLMPTQWRTIAPMVGRTPSQCLERYEKLLDAACAKDDNYEPGDDPRKLRPGEIDPNPEAKPARPDPVDMDEDEKEMLSEARARLANTRGKKAKRKAREKQLEEARRLASLQKRRELKAAGIDIRHRKRKRKGIDYNAEIPFEKRPPPGFYDAAEEDRPVEQPSFPTTIEELEGERRIDKEARLRKLDAARNKIAERQDAPAAILQANKLNDPEAVRRRSKLNLPAPQIPDHELEAIAKIGVASDLIGSEELTEGNAATRALLASYAQTPQHGMTPLRTPQRTPSGKQDALKMEAENQRRLTQSQTPLLGGENPMLHPSDFTGVIPKRKEIQTPNLLLTPSATPGASGLTPRIGLTPARDGYSFGMTPKGTPIRDELRINEDMDLRDGSKLGLSDSRRELVTGLKSLPQPKNEYQMALDPTPEETEEPEEKIEEDMSDRSARERAEEEARQQALLRKRSKVLQRELPRPPAASLDLIKESLVRAGEDKSSFVPPTPIEQADEMIRKELVSLLEHDNAKYPIDDKAEKKKGKKRKSAPIPEIEDFLENELKEAGNLIAGEAEFLCEAMGHKDESFDEFVEAHQTCLNDIMYFPTRGSYGLSSVAGNMEKVTALQADFENVKKKMDDDTKKAQNLEEKIKKLTHGYQMRAGKLWSQVEAIHKQMDTAETELQCFQALQKQELLAASNRINNLWEEVQKQKELEKTLQKRYGDRFSEKERIQLVLEEHRVKRMRMLEESSQPTEDVGPSAVTVENRVDAPAVEDKLTEGDGADPTPTDNDKVTEGGGADPTPMVEDDKAAERDGADPTPMVEDDKAAERDGADPTSAVGVDGADSTAAVKDEMVVGDDPAPEVKGDSSVQEMVIETDPTPEVQGDTAVQEAMIEADPTPEVQEDKVEEGDGSVQDIVVGVEKRTERDGLDQEKVAEEEKGADQEKVVAEEEKGANQEKVVAEEEKGADLEKVVAKEDKRADLEKVVAEEERGADQEKVVVAEEEKGADQEKVVAEEEKGADQEKVVAEEENGAGQEKVVVVAEEEKGADQEKVVVAEEEIGADQEKMVVAEEEKGAVVEDPTKEMEG